MDILIEQLTILKPPHVDLGQPAVIFTSPLVDPAPTMTLAMETLQACMVIFELTNWTVRILSKGNLLPEIARRIPERYRQRVIFGVSTGTMDDRLAQSFEKGAALVSERIESLRWLQDNGFRTYAMLCPTLPQAQDNYDAFVEDALDKVRMDRCEHVWGEVINLRVASLQATCDGLEKGGFAEESARLREVCGTGSKQRLEEYARNTFEALARHVPPEKLRFLQRQQQDYRLVGAAEAEGGYSPWEAV